MERKNTVAALALLLLSAPALAQAPKPDAFDKLIACVDDYAMRFAKTKEPASDIADAALSACSKHREAVVQQMLSVGAMTREGADRVAEGVAVELRRDAIRTVLETRNRPTR